jgi:hypothetical protein
LTVQAIPDDSLVKVENSGQFIRAEQPETALQVLMEFFN